MESFDNFEDQNTLEALDQAPTPFSFGRNFFVLIGNVLLGMFLAALFSAVVALVWGYNITELASLIAGFEPDADVNLVRAILGVNQLFTFLLPGLLTAFIIYKRDWIRRLYLSASPSIKNWVLGILILFCSLPLVQFTYWLNQQIPLPQSWLEQEESTAVILKMIMTYGASYEVIINLLLIAVLPAIGEEIVFRGLLQKNLEWATKNAHLSIWIAAFVFSFIHMQFAGFIPRLILGAVLGYLFYFTQNLWVPIIAHLFNNGIQVLADFFYKEEMSSVDIESLDSVPGYAGFISLVLVVGLLYIMKKINHKPETPIA